ncbi:vinculin-like [Hydractinia symbiolongicarpus]|uniref:vinculin-like n=1 Tax=Hydractinia symbiolongicarpus TaxID=13093 RepID=UPI00254BA0D5|nr:vinculin-like [Hydractinia symbiolongicarpus]
MPVFHTKTIEQILEPVAQQVSQLVVIHEQAEKGAAINDLTGPVGAVGAAVNNLVHVGRETAATSKDEILRKEMPVSFTKVEKASSDLIESTKVLKEDPYSVDGRKLLINGARGILNGTSALLLTFDDAEVRKILEVCRKVLDYIQVAEVVEVLADCVTFVKNLTPGIFNMAKKVEGRIQDLTHVTHRELLQKHIKSVKENIPLLIGSMKAYVSTLQTNVGRAEAQEGRNFIITKVCDDIIEIMRVLQLKVDDEYDLEDPTNLMRKARHRLQEKMKLAKDWLSNPDAEANGLGERALRDIIKQARQVGVLANDPKIKQLCDELDNLIDRISALRAKGLGHSPEALALAKEIDEKLDLLTKLVDDAIAREVAAGTRLPAATTQGQFDQALSWIDDPRSDPNSVGRRAIDALLADGRRLAEQLSGPEKQELLDTIDNVDKLTKRLAELKAQGKGNTPEALEIAAKLKKELEKLKFLLQSGATRGVVDNFMDVLTPIKHLEKAAKAPVDAPNREQEFEDKAGAFEYHTSRMIDSAEQTAVHGKHANRQLVDNIHSAAKDLAELTPQVSHAGKLLLLNPGNATIEAHFDLMKKNWIDKAEEVTALVDAATDAFDFVKHSEDAIRRDQASALVGLEQQNPSVVVAKAGNMARMSNRVTQVAKAEAENSEDPEYKHAVSMSAKELENSISPLVVSAKNVAINPKAQQVHIEFKVSSDGLIEKVVDVKKALDPTPTPPPTPPPDLSTLTVEEPPEVPPPRPPPPIVEGLIAADESQELHSMLEQPPDADNRMAVAAHQLHVEASKWEEEGNLLIQAARQMAMLFAKMSKFITDEEYFATHSKKELIETAKMIAKASTELVKQARQIANKCPDKRMRHDLLLTIDRIPTIATQLKILATVKATMFGANDPQADLEATEMLVGCAENLMGSARSVVKDCEAASIKIRSGQGQIVQWKREQHGSNPLDRRY